MNAWTVVVVICFFNYVTSKTDLQKCCASGELIRPELGCAVIPKHAVLNNFTDIKVYDENLNAIGIVSDVFNLVPTREFDFNASTSTIDLGLEPFQLENGSMRFRMPDDEMSIKNKDEYCIDYYYSMKYNKSRPMFWLFPEKEDETKESPLHEALFIAAQLISSFFLMCVLVVFILLPELRTLGGLVQMCFFGSLMTTFTLMATLKLRTASGAHTAMECKGFTFSFYFFFLASFFWTNVMSFDIWRIFRRDTTRDIGQRNKDSRFAMYSLYGWGVPLIMTIGAITVNEIEPKSMILPGIPYNGCFIDGIPRFYYLHLPILVLLAINWTYYLLTVRIIWRLYKQTDNTQTPMRRSQKEKNRFKVYIKLSIIMGVSWVLEVLSTWNPDLPLWTVTDAYNALTGILIFIVFVCNRKIWRKICKKFQKAKPHATGSRYGSGSGCGSTSMTDDSSMVCSQPMVLKSQRPSIQEF